MSKDDVVRVYTQNESWPLEVRARKRGRSVGVTEDGDGRDGWLVVEEKAKGGRLVVHSLRVRIRNVRGWELMLKDEPDETNTPEPLDEVEEGEVVEAPSIPLPLDEVATG